MQKWQCILCGFIYDEKEGSPEHGIEPRTPWDEIPDDWSCPDCGATKRDFVMVAVSQ